MIAVDTNVLIYARDPRDRRKQEIALGLVRTIRDGALIWQVACEYIAASRKLAPYGFDAAAALIDVRDLRLIWTNVLPSWTAIDRCSALQASYSLSF